MMMMMMMMMTMMKLLMMMMLLLLVMMMMMMKMMMMMMMLMMMMMMMMMLMMMMLMVDDDDDDDDDDEAADDDDAAAAGDDDDDDDDDDDVECKHSMVSQQRIPQECHYMFSFKNEHLDKKTAVGVPSHMIQRPCLIHRDVHRTAAICQLRSPQAEGQNIHTSMDFEGYFLKTFQYTLNIP